MVKKLHPHYGSIGEWYISYHGPPKPTCLEVFMVHNLVLRWPKPLFFMVLGAHSIHEWVIFMACM